MNLNQVTIVGRVDLVEFHNGKHYSIVTSPAIDAYSHPARFKVVSDNPFGQVNQTFLITCSLGGIVRPRNYKDAATGQPRVFQEADVYFNVLTAVPHTQQQQPAQKQQ